MLSIYLRLIWSYFKISIFGFGGGYAMLSLIRHGDTRVVIAAKSFPPDGMLHTTRLLAGSRATDWS